MSTRGRTANIPPPCRLTVFAFLWACQSLEHQEFFPGWIHQDSGSGWTLTVLAILTVLWPGSLALFIGMLATSVAYNVSKWPFVVNHILVESVINVTILAAIARSWGSGRRDHRRGPDRGDAYDRFAPVVRAVLVAVYCWAFVAKLNTGFLNPEVSCSALMYADLTERVPLIPAGAWTRTPAIGLTLLVEAAIPFLLLYRRTRSSGVVLALGFHFVLGMIGHRTFSTLAFALLGLFCMDGLLISIVSLRVTLEKRWGSARPGAVLGCMRIGATLLLVLIVADLKLGPFLGVRLGALVWMVWSLVVAGLYLRALVSTRQGAVAAGARSGARPGLLWGMLALVILNGSAQYLGLKTQTSFTMYSNLRTEGGMNNHLFMPALRWFDYQDDLVEVIDTNHPELQKYLGTELWITFFEFRRIVSETVDDFHATYRRGGETREVALRGGISSDPELSRRHPLWLAKLLYFRPVDRGSNPRCQH